MLRKIAGAKLEWTDEYEVAFQELKKYLLKPTLLTSLHEGENMFVYLAVSDLVLTLHLWLKEIESNITCITSARCFIMRKCGIFC